jgi:hypothetical protein
MYNNVAHPRKYPHPIFAYILFLLMQYCLFNEYSEGILLFCQLLFYVAISCSPPPKPRLDENRVIYFNSKLLKNKIQWGNNHMAYILFNFDSAVIGVYNCLYANVDNYLAALAFWVVLGATLMFLANFVM